MNRHRVTIWRFVALSLSCGALLAGSCPPTETPTSNNNPGGNTPNTRNETWSVQLDQDKGGTPGRIWLIANMTLRDDSARTACAGTTITTGLGSFSGQRSRIQSSNLNGSVSGSWTRGFGDCDAFSLTLSPQGQGDYVVTGTRQISSFAYTSRGFGAIDHSVFIGGTWSFGGNVRGTAYVYPTQLAYMPDSHFDVQMLVSETGCNLIGGGCEIPYSSAATVCLHTAPVPLPECFDQEEYQYYWLADTTISTTLSRQAEAVNDQWFFSLLERFDGGGPNFQIGCDRRFDGPDLVQVRIVSGVYSPYVTCSTGWTSTGVLNKTAGDEQTAAVGATLPLSLQVQLLAGTGNPQAQAPIAWKVTGGGGSLNAATTTTDASGHTSVQWTLGSVAGQQTVTATAGIPGGGTTSVTFRATATAPPSATCQGAGTPHNGTIIADERWTAAASPHHVGTLTVNNGAVLRIDPGALVCVTQSQAINFLGGARLVSGGVPPGPQVTFQSDSKTGSVDWYGISLGGAVAPDSILNTVIKNADAAITGSDSLVMIGGGISSSAGIAFHLTSPSVHIVGSTIDGGGAPGGTSSLLVQLVAPTSTSDIVFASRVINAPGVALAAYGPGVTLNNCEISYSGADGVRVGASSGGLGNVSITNCNITNNAGLAVNAPLNMAATAEYVWWGLPACPGTSPPNGITAQVACSLARTGPVVLGYAPPARKTASQAPRSFAP